jgi:hypothetical protein
MALCLLAFAALALFLAGPRIFLAKWLNRDLGGDGYFQKVSAESFGLGLFLDRLTVKGLKLARGHPAPETLELAEIRVDGLSAFKVLKASLGLADWLSPFADAPVEIRGADCPFGLGPLAACSLNTLSLKFFIHGAPAADGAGHFGLAYLKLTDLSLKAPAASLYFREELAVGPGDRRPASLRRPAPGQSEIPGQGAPAIGQGDPASLGVPAAGDSPAAAPNALASLSPSAAGGAPVLVPGEAASPGRPAADPAGSLGEPLSSLEVEAMAVAGLSLSFAESLTLSGLSLAGPEGRASIGSLAASAIRPWDLYLIGGPGPAGFLKALAAFGELEVAGLAASQGPWTPGHEGQGHEGPGPGLALAKGYWANPEGGEAARLALDGFAFSRPDVALLAAQAEGRLSDPAALALWEALGPRVAGDLSLLLPKGRGLREGTASLSLRGQGDLKASFWGPGEFFASLAQGRLNALALASGFGQGEISYLDRGLAKEWLAAFKAQAGSDEALAGLLADFVAAGQGYLADPGAIAGEIGLFFAEPGSLTVRWSPPPGYPMSSIKKMASESGPAGLLGLQPADAEAAARRGGYLALNDLGLTVSVNGRPPAPVTALEPGAKAPAPGR